MDFIRKTANGLLAGIMVSFGGAVFVGCSEKWVAAVLFCIALICICPKGYALFTGKVGFIAFDSTKEAWSVLLTALLGNTLGTILCGLAVRYAIPTSAAAAEALCAAKLANQTLPQTFLRGMFCGMLMYLAVSLYKAHDTKTGILFGIPVFILSGFEHSIADEFYFVAAGVVSGRACAFLWAVILGNACGSLIIAYLEKLCKGK